MDNLLRLCSYAKVRKSDAKAAHGRECRERPVVGRSGHVGVWSNWWNGVLSRHVSQVSATRCAGIDISNSSSALSLVFWDGCRTIWTHDCDDRDDSNNPIVAPVKDPGVVIDCLAYMARTYTLLGRTILCGVCEQRICAPFLRSVGQDVSYNAPVR